MSHLIPYLALGSFPAAYLLALNPISFYWGLRHGFEPMPAGLRERAETVDRRYVHFVMYALLATFIAVLMRQSNVRRAAVGMALGHWMRNAGVGFAAGVLMVIVQGLLDRTLPKNVHVPTTDRFTRGSVELWVLVALVAAFAEELWIAFCLVNMKATGHSPAVSVTITALIFGAMHLAYRPCAALSVSVRGMISALLFLWLGSLIPMFLFHFIGGLGNLYWLRRSTVDA